MSMKLSDYCDCKALPSSVIWTWSPVLVAGGPKNKIYDFEARTLEYMPVLLNSLGLMPYSRRKTFEK